MTDPGDGRDSPDEEGSPGTPDSGRETDPLGGPDTERDGGSQRSPAADEGEQPQQGVEHRPVGRQSRDPPPGPPGQHTGNEDNGPSSLQLFAWDVVSSILAVALFGLFLFAISGVWPPMVAIESGSMEPNMNTHDLVFVMDADRFPAAEATGGAGVVPADRGAETGYTEFGAHGDVIIFQPDGRADETPIIHRAMLWVEEGENWYDRADESYLRSANSCSELRNCPAPHDGYITKGDNNAAYDQSRGLSEPVQPEWVVGTAEVRVPGLGWLRLQFQ